MKQLLLIIFSFTTILSWSQQDSVVVVVDSSKKVNIDSIYKVQDSIDYQKSWIPYPEVPSYRVGRKYVQFDTTVLNFHELNFFNTYDLTGIGSLNFINRPFVDSLNSEAPYIVSNIFHPYLKPNHFYHSPYNFTKGYYSLGTKNQQYFNIIHVQKLGTHAGFSLEFDKLTSRGFMFRHQQDFDNLNIKGFITSPRKKYWSFLNVQRFNGVYDINGGFETDPRSFDQTASVELFPVRINALQSRRNYNIAVDHILFFTKEDSVRNYTPDYYSGMKAELDYFEGILKYDENPNEGSFLDTTFYPDYFFDSTRTYDNRSLKLLHGKLAFRQILSKNRERPKWIGIKGVFQKGEYQIASDVNLYDNIGVEAASYMVFNKFFNIDYQVKYIVAGYNLNNLILKLKNEFTLGNKGGVLNADLYYQLYKPQIEDLKFESNNFIWDNDFKDRQDLRLKLKYSLPQARLKVFGELINHQGYIYNDSSSQAPTQLDESLFVAQVGLNHHLKVKAFNWENTIKYTYSSNTNVLVAPELFVKSSMYYYDNVIKEKLGLQIGASVTYFTAYNAYTFVPATNRYLIGNDFLAGNYPFVDVFVNASLGKVRFFVQSSHVNSGLLNLSYFSAKDYIFNERIILFGLDWRFNY